jgi:GNAT superfamily N-acetyltransferase
MITTLRKVAAADTAFLLRLYASTRAEERALTGWDEASWAAFVHMQFEAQDRSYRAHFPHASHQVIECDGRPVGRLWVARSATDIRILDVALLPCHRARNIGGQCLLGVLAEAQAAGLPVRLHVEQFNPARRLYERLGFVPTADQGLHCAMEWLPGTATLRGPAHEPAVVVSHDQLAMETCDEQT